MMEVCKLASRVPIYPRFIAVSLLVGWLIPEFYAWTDSDQSRPSSLLWQVPLSSAIVSVALLWLPITVKQPNAAERPPTRFSLRMFLMLTACIAVTIALLVKFPLVASWIVPARHHGGRQF